jgi:hypothetical protein
MTLTQAIEIARLAKSIGYATRASEGKVQIVSVTYDAKGRSDVSPVSDWLDYAAALAYLTKGE